MSAVSLFLAAVLIQIIAPKLKLPRISFRLWWLGLTAFTLTLLPYFIWVLYSADDSLNLKEASSYSIPVLFNAIKFEQYLGECVIEGDGHKELMEEGLQDEAE